MYIRQPDYDKVYKDITLLNSWKEHGDRRFLGRLHTLEMIEANDVWVEYEGLKERLEKAYQAIDTLVDYLEDNDLELPDRLRKKITAIDMPF